MTPLVTLYGKPGCHLCDEARVVVESVRAKHAFELEEVDITRDPALEAEYRERIPVLTVGGEPVAELVIDPTVLEERLATLTT
jgi:glutaredoxin